MPPVHVELHDQDDEEWHEEPHPANVVAEGGRVVLLQHQSYDLDDDGNAGEDDRHHRPLEAVATDQVPGDRYGTNDQEADVVDLVEEIGLLEADVAEGQPGKSQACEAR